MKRYTIFQAPIMAFFSPSFYRDVGLNWKGTGFTYLFLLLAICWVPGSILFHLHFANLIETKTPAIIPQIPQIKIINGEASVEVIQPFKIINPESGTVLALIDTTGKTVSLEGTEARVLLTRTELRYRKNDGTTTGFDFKWVEEFTLDQQRVSGWLRVLRDYGGVFAFVFKLIASFAFRIVQLLIYAAIGLLFAKWCKTSQSYQTLLRLSGMAITPVIIANTIVKIADITIPLEWVLYFIAAMAYLFLGVKAVSHKKNAQDREVDSRPVHS